MANVKGPMPNFSRRAFDKAFPDDAACLRWLMARQHPLDVDGAARLPCASKACAGAERKYHRVKARPSYSCDVCGIHYFPMKGTIFAHSSTPLKTWFLAIFLVATTRTGFPAKWLQRETGVTYKTAFRMLHQIRSLLDEMPPTLRGKVEVDETYVGGRKVAQHDKTKIVGLIERGGRAYTEIIPNVRAATLVRLVRRYVEPGAMVYTDELRSYYHLPRHGYGHKTVSHMNRE